MDKLKNKSIKGLRWLEQYTNTDMVYLVKNSFWMNTSTVITSIFAFILSITFARFLDKETYGMYQFLISISSILGAMTLTGMNAAVIQAVARGFEGVFKKSVETQIKFGIIPFVAGVIASLYYLLNGNHVLSVSILIMAIFLPFANALNTWGSFLSGKKDFKNSFVYSQIINIIYYAGMISCIFIFPNAIVLIFANFLLVTISNLIVYFAVIKKYKPNENNEAEALSYGKKLSLSSILPMIALNIDNIAIFHFLGATQLAIYAFASNIPERIGGLLRPISTAAFPKFAEKDPEEIKKVLPKKTLQLFLLSLLGGVFYLILAPFVYKIFFPQYIDSIFYSQIYVLVIIIATTSSLPMVSLFATRSKGVYKFNIYNPLFNIVIIISFVYFWGIWGAIFGKIISNLFQLVISSYFVQKN